MHIIVSAFISNINQQKSIEKYIEYGKQLLSDKINNYKLFFIERRVYNTYFNNNKDKDKDITQISCEFKYEDKIYNYIICDSIIFVFFEKTDNYLYNYIDKITQFNVSTDNPGKDTLEYMFIQCHKSEWMKIAINLIELIKTKKILSISNDNLQFIWIDFGIFHIFNNETLFYNEIKNMNAKPIQLKDKVRIGSCIHPSNTYHSDIYKNIAWYFAGGVFGGSAVTILKFANIMKSECISIIKERNHLMWEVNIWYLIYLKHPELFDPYNCDHNPSIIANY